MTEPAIEIKGLSKRFGPVRALEGLDLCVERGKVLALLGPNGAGKTTCLRILMGLLRADKGTARVLGRDPWSAPPEHRRRVGYLSEDGFAWPVMTFRRAVEFVSSFFPTWDGPYVESLIDLLQIPAGASFAAMSKGQAQKAALALVLGPKPEVLLLDDPAAGLDPAARRDMVAALAGLLRRTGSTILFSSHIMSDVERLADEVLIVAGGRTVLKLPIEELKGTARRVLVRVPEESVAALAVLPGVVRARREDQVTALTVLGYGPEWMDGLRAALGSNLDGVQESPLGLEDLYIDVVAAAEAGWRLAAEARP